MSYTRCTLYAVVGRWSTGDGRGSPVAGRRGGDTRGRHLAGPAAARGWADGRRGQGGGMTRDVGAGGTPVGGGERRTAAAGGPPGAFEQLWGAPARPRRGPRPALRLDSL